MCGLVVIYKNSERQLDPRLLEGMIDTMYYRGPDDYGFSFVEPKTHCLWREELPEPICAKGVAMGHRRLSILDLSVSGRQPFVSNDKRFWLVYNGEIYNYLELRTELANLGYNFRTATDTEVLLIAYAHWGSACFNRFNGMWAFVVWDNQEQTLVACRDRFGKKPLYYSNIKGDWIFASEVKALLRHPAIERRPNSREVFYYLSGFTHGPFDENTCFDNIKAVPPGSYLILRQGRIELKKYWELPDQPRLGINDLDQAVEQFGELFTDSVKLRLRADVRVGTMLSGGLDSTSVITTVNDLLLTTHDKTRQVIGDSLQAFNASFPGHAIDESDRVDELCQRLNLTVHKVFPMEQECVEKLFQDVVYNMEAPFISSVQIVHTLLMRRARSAGVTVVLNGQGSDEMLGGYPEAYCRLAALALFFRFHWIQSYCETRAMAKRHGISSKEAAKAFLLMLMPTSLIAWHTRRKLSRGALFRQDIWLKFAPSHWAIRDRQTPGRTVLDRSLRRDFFQEVLPSWLHMEDRVSMSASIESRLPFLDYRLVEFAFNLDDSLKIRNGETKYVLRKVMQNRLPTSIVSESRKYRFSGPDAFWLMGSLKPLLQAMLLQGNPRVSEWIEPRALSYMISRFLKGDEQSVRPDFVWRIFNTEMWLRTFF
jgi:asparagine synthase (glutamine-hydrolysing)